MADDDDTGRMRLLHLADSGSELAPIARELSRLVAAADRERGARIVWRGLGGIAATIALAIAGWALQLGQTAATDHERLDRVEVSAERAGAAVEALDRDTRTRLDPIALSLARIEALSTRIEAQLTALDERLGDVERDRRRDR